MGRRKNKTRSGPLRLELEEVVSDFKSDDDSTTDKEEQRMFERLRERTDVLSEVFSRLPPQTLFRFMCVSKHFCNFIRQADFPSQHYRNCKAIAGRALTGLFFQKINTSFGLVEWNICYYISVNSEAGGVPDPSLEFLWQVDYADVVEIIDSCNGLLLCSNTTWASNVTTCFVCNPLTREKMALPHPRKPTNRISYALMADLDHNCLKYRVLCLVRSKFCDKQYSKLSIFCSETGEWMEIEEKLPPVSLECLSGSKIFFNGSLYWDCLEGYILACDFNLTRKEPCYRLIKAPSAPLGRSSWKSSDRIHCYCHGFEDDFPEWTLSKNDSADEKEDFTWKLEDCDDFRCLTDDVSAESSVGWVIERKNQKPRVQFKVISYDPESKTVFLFIPDIVYTYQFTERRLEHLGGIHSD